MGKDVCFQAQNSFVCQLHFSYDGQEGHLSVGLDWALLPYHTPGHLGNHPT
jgi:hypothetical protein